MNQNEIIALISAGETDRGIELLMESEIGHFPTYQQEAIILLSSRMNGLKKKYHLGLMTAEEYDVARNKLSLDLLYILKNTTNDTPEPRTTELPPNYFEGKKIGNYELLKYIGAGGFGTVYLARQIHLDRFYAIKISHEIKVDRQYLDSIMSFGIRALQALKHPNVITIHDVGELEVDSQPRIYIVMDYVGGGHLDDWPKVNLSKTEVLQKIAIYKKIAQAIDAAHNLVHHNKFGFETKGLYHGDIKPRNVLLNEQQEPVVIDFMFVDMNSLYEIIVNTPQKMEQSTAAFGTPGYMPHEQEQNGKVNRQTDIYSLGVLLFELFSASRFASFQPPKTKAAIDAHLKKENPHLPESVAAVIFKATQEAPEERFQTVGALLEALDKADVPWWRGIFGGQ